LQGSRLEGGGWGARPDAFASGLYGLAASADGRSAPHALEALAAVAADTLPTADLAVAVWATGSPDLREALRARREDGAGWGAPLETALAVLALAHTEGVAPDELEALLELQGPRGWVGVGFERALATGPAALGLLAAEQQEPAQRALEALAASFGSAGWPDPATTLLAGLALSEGAVLRASQRPAVAAAAKRARGPRGRALAAYVLLTTGIEQVRGRRLLDGLQVEFRAGLLMETARQVRDTAMVLEALSEQPAATEELAAQVWLAARPMEGLGTLELAQWAHALALRGLTVPQAAEALAARQGPAGGFGVRRGHRADPLSTAEALAALLVLGQGESPAAERALDWLLQASAAGQGFGWEVQESTFLDGRILGLLGPFEATLPPRAGPMLEATRLHLAATRTPDGRYGSTLATAAALGGLLRSGVRPAALSVEQTVQRLREEQRDDGSFEQDPYLSAMVAWAMVAVRSNLEPGADGLRLDPPAPSRGQAGVRLLVQVDNRGVLNAGASRARFFLGHPDEGGTPLGEAVAVPAVEAEGSAAIVGRWDVDDDAAGPQTLCALLDADDEVPEADEGDNLICRQVEVTTLPDLAASSADLDVEPDPARTDAPLTVTADVHNPLLGTAEPFAVELLLVLPGLVERLGRWDELSLDGRATLRLQHEVAADELSPGAYDLCLHLDPDEEVQEADETNNLVCVVLPVLRGSGFNLRLTARELSFDPAAPLVGQQVRLRAEVLNAGDQRSPTSEVLFAVTHPELGREVVVGPLQPVPELDPGAARAVSLLWDPELLAGELELAAWVDPFDLLDELAENDNLAVRQLTLATVDRPDLRLRPEDLTLLDGPAVAWQPLTLAVRVRNLGGVAADGVLLRVYDGDPNRPAGAPSLGDNLALGHVPAGGQATLTVRTQLGPGAHELHVVVDPAGLVEESSEDNNEASLALNVAPSAGVDLAVAERDLRVVPEPARPRQPFTVEVAVHNLGLQDAPGVAVALYEDEPSPETLLGTARTAALLAGGTAPAYIPLTHTGGLLRLVAVVDPEQEVAEAERSNNRAERTLQLVWPDAVDLAVGVTDLSVRPAAPLEQEPVRLRAQVHNVGAHDAMNVGVAFYVGLPHEGGQLISEERVDMPGASVTLVEADARLDVGLDQICVVLDPSEEVAEHDERNNITCRHVGVVPPGDLVVDAAFMETVPAIPVRGQPLAVRAVVSNQGGRPTPAGSALAIYAAAEDSLAEPELVGRADIPGLAVGAAATLELPWAGSQDPGFMVLTAVADVDDTLRELQESNNRAAHRVFVAYPDRAELRAVQGTQGFWPQRPLPGEGIELVVEVENYGTADAVGLGVVFFLGDPADGVVIGEALIAELRPGRVMHATARWGEPEQGLHTVTAVVNPTGAVLETVRDDNSAVFDLPLVSRPPQLEHTGEDSWTDRHGMRPRWGGPQVTFSFRVRYQDPDGDPPAEGWPQVVLDLDGDGELAGSVGGMAEGGHAMQEVDPDDQDVTDGKLYAVDLQLPPSRRSQYRFEAVDVLGSSAEALTEATDWQPGPWVHAEPVVVAMPTYPSWPNKEVVLWGRLLEGADSAADGGLRYRWEPGDGSPALEGEVTVADFVAVRHTYARLGTFTARLTVTDSTGRADTSLAVVQVQPHTPDRVRQAAIEDGLRALYRFQSANGAWADTAPVAATGMSLLAFENNRHFADDDPEEYVYALPLQRGFDWLVWRSQERQMSGSESVFDRNRNGVGRFWTGTGGEGLYINGMALYPFLASDDPGQWSEFVQDATDWLMYAQDANGGWRYGPRGGADNSVAQWPVLAVGEAQLCPFSADVPQWVWADSDPDDPYGFGLMHWLDYSREHNMGGFGYDRVGASPVLTSAGAIGLWAVGRDADDEWVAAAIDLYARSWNNDQFGAVWGAGSWEGTFTDYYGAYGFAKMMRLFDQELVGDVEWLPDLSELILRGKDTYLLLSTVNHPLSA